MNIAIDIDDVIVDFINGLIVFHNERYGTTFTKADFSFYEYEDVWGGTLANSREKIDEFYKTNHFKELQPMPGSVEALTELKKKGHKLFLVTGRDDALTENTARWVEKHFPKFFSGIYHTNHYNLHSSKRVKKSEVCKKLKAEVFIDDDPTHIKDCAAASISVFVFDHPWNRGELPKNATRVYSWDEIVEKINALGKVQTN